MPKKEQQKNVSELIQDCVDKMCDGYCKYHDLIETEDDEERVEALTKKYCLNCPLVNL